MSKKAKKSTGDWAEAHKSSGASVIERRVHGCRLTVVPKNWTRRTGESIWSVSCDASGRHERGEASTLGGAKVAAMHSAKKLEREARSGAKKAKSGVRAKVSGAKKVSAKKAKATGRTKAKKPRKPSPAHAARPRAKSVGVPRKGSTRRHVEDLRQRTASLLAGLPPAMPMLASLSSPPSNREMEADIVRVADQG